MPAGGLSADLLRWVSPRREGYFLPQAALAMRFRTRLKEALQQQQPLLLTQIPRAVWSLDWVADVQPVGTGEPALKYLAAYVYRTAFSAERILADDGRFITFTYRDGNDHRTRSVRLCPEHFLHRFLQHVLPQGLQRVRHFGWLSAAARARWKRVLSLLDWQPPALSAPQPIPVPICRECKKPMVLIGALPRAPPR